MVADRRVFFDGYLAPFLVRKVFSIKDMLVGLAGDPAVAIIIESMEPFEGCARDVQRWVTKNEPDGTVALIVEKGELWECNSKGIRYKVNQPYWAIGVGEPALGFLAGALSQGAELNPSLAQQAIRFVSTVHAGVSPESDVYHVG